MAGDFKTLGNFTVNEQEWKDRLQSVLEEKFLEENIMSNEPWYDGEKSKGLVLSKVIKYVFILFRKYQRVWSLLVCK